MSKEKQTPNDRPAWQAAGLSLILPGSGQFMLRQPVRGLSLLLTMVLLGLLIRWQGTVTLVAPLIAIWLWNCWDAYQLARGKKLSIGAPLLLATLTIYGLGVTATEFKVKRLVTGYPNIKPILGALVNPELIEYPTNDIVGAVPIQVPCIDPLPDPAKSPSADPAVTVSVPCAQVDDEVSIKGEGFLPNFEGELWWLSPIGDVQRVITNGEPVYFTTDSDGRFQAKLSVPLAVPVTSIPAEGETQTHVIRAEQHQPYGSLQPTQTLSLVVEKIGETVALAFMATLLGLIFALPVSFLAARNLMWANRFTRAVYYVVRTILNVVRSIETLIWAIIFAVWVGLGPFGGMLALMLHTIAALGKLYSEAIESIDPGPIEALRATGASMPQVVVYAVLPQIVPTFLSFTLYRWDINVRMSTVVGLISDAGLGFLVVQWIRLNRFRSMATAIIAIVLVVAIIDYVSAKLRERVIAGTPAGHKPNPTRQVIVRVALVLGFLVAFIWSWNIARINLVDFVTGVPEGLRLARSFLIPEMFTRPTEEPIVSVTLPVPCGSGDPAINDVSGARVDISLSCGEVGDPLMIQGHGLPPDTEVSVRWALSDGAYLRVDKDCCTTDGAGTLRWETTIHPLMKVDPEGDRPEPGQVVVTWKEFTGGPRLSQTFKTVFDLALVTLLMALMATTLGSIFAIPLSFFAARNIMGNSRLGRGVYYAFRTLFNLWRSVEPMILALICSAWVGLGPFAGVLALAINNIPNLAKLFSETIEEIDTGPVEAITATGANKAQLLIYAIVPQLAPKFLAFILYQWDINIRMSTVVGFVGGGGIGQFFRIQTQLNQYSAAGMAVWAIVFMVWSMDYVSARAREYLT